MNRYLAICLLVFASFVYSNELDPHLQSFQKIYQTRFGLVAECGDQVTFRVCSSVLRNEGVAPFILHHGKKTEKAVVLFHGLSDSPFYIMPYAKHLHAQGMNVVVALLPGHGLGDNELAKQAMLDYDLSAKWRSHVAAVMELAPDFGDSILIGGFSTGGALAVDYTLSNPINVKGIVLFSGALAISDNAESLSRIWGVSKLARWLDRNFNAIGQNPYKYSTVPSSGGLELMEIIEGIREKLEQGLHISQPIFVAHSEADITTPIEGVKSLLTFSSNQNTVYYIGRQHAVCHANLMLDEIAVKEINIDKFTVDPRNPCAMPKANPVFDKVSNLLSLFLIGI